MKRALWPWLVLAAIMTLPAWVAKHPPVEDWAVHLATLRVIHSLHDPAYGFDRDFVLVLGRTQYIGFYVTGDALAYVLGVPGAYRVLVSAFASGTLLAMRWLLLALGRDPRPALLMVPLLYGPLFVLGLFPFLLGIPLLLCTLGLLYRHAERPSLGRGAALAAALTVLFAWHVIPFGIGAFATIAVTRIRGLSLRVAWPVVPACICVCAWLFGTDAGRQTLDVMRSSGHRMSLMEAAAGTWEWTVDAFVDPADDLLGLGVLGVGAMAVWTARQDKGPARTDGMWTLPAFTALLYFATAKEHGFVWPLSQRFAMLTAVLAITLVPWPRGPWGTRLAWACAALAVGVVANVSWHFMRFESNEVGDLELAMAQIPARSHVAALVFSPTSPTVRFSPLLHSGSYFQAERGGVVLFSFVGYNHWPIDYLPGRAPPFGPAPPRWEWTPQLASPDGDLAPYFNFLLVQGEGLHDATRYELRWRGAGWSVWALR